MDPHTQTDTQYTNTHSFVEMKDEKKEIIMIEKKGEESFFGVHSQFLFTLNSYS